MNQREPKLVVAVLAAGSSRRFGLEDKLTADWGGTMLGNVVARTLTALPSAQRVVIASDPGHPCAPAWRKAGWNVLHNRHAHEGMGTSAALAGAYAQNTDADALLLSLADMPLVPLHHYQSLTEKAQRIGRQAIVASAAGEMRTPPACFGAAHFADLKGLKGDRGARDMLRQAVPLECAREWLADIDSSADLAALKSANG